jgi:hypothetical protein
VKSYNQFLLEKSSLNQIDIPREIMQIIQYDYEFDVNINWNKSEKNDIIIFPNITIQNKSNLFVCISEDLIFFVFAYKINDNIYYNYDEFKKIEDDFGEGWIRDDKVELDLKTIVRKLLGFKGDVYHAYSGDYKITNKLRRKLHEIDITFNDLTEKFLEKVEDKLDKIGINFSGVKKGSGLKPIEDKLLRFENEFSEIKNKYITIVDIINEFGMDKAVYYFIYYVKTDKILI